MAFSGAISKEWSGIFAIASAFLIALAGLLTMSGLSLDDPYFVRQGSWIVLSFFSCLIFSRIDYHFLRDTKVVTALYILSLLILVAVFIFGKVSKGAQSWFSFLGVSFQPSDLVKLILIIVLAKYLSKRHKEIAYFKHILVTFFYLCLPFILVVLQPDLGSALVLCSIWFGLLLFSGISRKHIFLVFGSSLLIFLLAWGFLFKPYQKARIINFVHPLSDIRGTGYNAHQSIIAVGSGGLSGKGIGYGTQSRLEFLPEYKTDFIFAAYSEEWGFIGSLSLLLLFFFLFSRLLYFASSSYSNFEALFTYGVVIWFITHTLVNIGMNVGVMPVTGIPLPFMSYGGTHLLIESIALGMCIGMFRYRKNFNRDIERHTFTL
jgi:rod shape determining protein RodA